HYSFLDSTLSPARLIAIAKENGIKSVALTDTGNLHGAAEFVMAAKDAGIKPILGTEIHVGGRPLLLYSESSKGYHNLCPLLFPPAKLGAKAADEGSVAAAQRRSLHPAELDGLTSGLVAVGADGQLAERFPKAFYQMAASRDPGGNFAPVAVPAIHYGA